MALIFHNNLLVCDKFMIYLWWRHHWEGVHDSVWVFLTDFTDQQGTHSRTSSSSQRVAQLEPLKTVTALWLLTYNIKDRVYKFCSFCVVTLGPVVSSSTLSKHEVIWTEDLTKGTRTNWIHGSRFQINKNSSGHIFSTSGFIVVDVDSFQLKIRVTMVCASWFNPVLIRDNLHEQCTEQWWKNQICSRWWSVGCSKINQQ